MFDLHTDYPLARARMVEDAERAARHRLARRRLVGGRRRLLARINPLLAWRRTAPVPPGDTTPELDRAA